MAHELSTTADGRTAMMYCGEAPWHGLGTRLDAPATAAEAIAAAGLDYEVTLTPMATTDGLPVPQRRAVVRADTRVVLGVVSDRFVPVQNRQAFGFLDALVAEGGLRYHTAGALGQGERIWLLAKLPEQIRVRGGDDLVDKYLLLSNAHNGSAALRVLFTPVRVVCANTLSLAHRQGAGEGVSIMHKGDLEAKIRQAQQVLGLAQRFFDDAAAVIDRLAGYSPSSAQLTAYFRELYPDPEENKNNGRAAKARAELQRLFEEGVGHDQPGVKGTAWAAYNAVTEYVDHHRSARGLDDRDRASRRLDSIWFGHGAQVKERAWNLALEMATSN
jgi:phage/plasmid-like protein (TIGR03299 family)